MSILDIKTYPDEVLSRVAKPVKSVTPAYVQISDDMLETMYKLFSMQLVCLAQALDLRQIQLKISHACNRVVIVGGDFAKTKCHVQLPRHLHLRQSIEHHALVASRLRRSDRRLR